MDKNKGTDMQHNVLLAPFTTIQLGGPAQQYVRCHSVEEVQSALAAAQDNAWPVHILGGGSNTIFADEGFAGLVIHIDLKGIQFFSPFVTAAAGEGWDNFVVQCIERNFAGVECLSGIPGLVGATPMQNVGAYGQEVAETIVSVKALDRTTLKIVEFTNKECEFAYRTSRFKSRDKDRYIITEVTFRLTPSGAPTIKYPELARVLDVGDGSPSLQSVREAVFVLRRKKSMVVDPADPNTRSCGSFFMNPVVTLEEFNNLTPQSSATSGTAGQAIQQSGNTSDSTIPHFPLPDGTIKIPAAFLIEQAGFRKGERRGGVGISTNHMLALVNYGGTAAELLSFAAEIQTKVRQKFGIELAQEPVTVSPLLV